MAQKTINELTEKVTIVDDDEFEIYDSENTNSKKVTLSTLYGSIAGAVPVGGTTAWNKSFPNTPALPAQFVEANGQEIDDASSVFDGYRAPNENGADVVLTVTYTADGRGAYATVAATDITALKQGDDVTGSGIAAGSTITDITGTTVTISDTDASGDIES